MASFETPPQTPFPTPGLARTNNTSHPTPQHCSERLSPDLRGAPPLQVALLALGAITRAQVAKVVGLETTPGRQPAQHRTVGPQLLL